MQVEQVEAFQYASHYQKNKQEKSVELKIAKLLNFPRQDVRTGKEDRENLERREVFFFFCFCFSHVRGPN